MCRAYLSYYTSECLYHFLFIQNIPYILRLEEQGVTLNDDLIKMKKTTKYRSGGGGDVNTNAMNGRINNMNTDTDIPLVSRTICLQYLYT